MKHNSDFSRKVVLITAAVAAAVFIAVTAFYKPLLALIEAAVFAVVAIIALILDYVAKKRYKSFKTALVTELDMSEKNALESIPFAAVVCDAAGNIKWYNSRFISAIAALADDEISDITKFTNGVDLETFANCEGAAVTYSDRAFSVFSSRLKIDGKDYFTLYFVDETELREIEREFNFRKPAIIYVEVDSPENHLRNYKESEIAEIGSGVEAALENWLSDYSGVMKRLNSERYIIFTESRYLAKMIEDKFSVLKTVREYQYKGIQVGTTLSIGISYACDTLSECENSARISLKKALSRGGDQVALALDKNNDNYSFFGGVAQLTEKTDKVQIRVLSSTLSELMSASDNIIIMGHTYPDLDVFGAAAGLCAASKAMGVKAYIATNEKRTLANTLVERMKAEGMADNIISEAQAVEMMTKKTLLIVVDTHIESFTEFPYLCSQASSLVVIDHHRAAVNSIKSAVINYHDISASSTCEMVTELLYYMKPQPRVTPLVAEALMAGIMLDTKNFVLRADVRTFEAAAFLKDKGADTVKVKKLFANSMTVSQKRNAVIASAENYGECVIACADFKSKDIRIICAQAADELLNVADVKAAFVIFEDNETVNISARSYGEMNVQIVMEQLSGGGHQTMAATQFRQSTVEEAREKLCKAIDAVNENR